MNTFENIKNTWNKANKKIESEHSLNAEVIKNAIMAHSTSVTSTLIKSIKFGIAILAIDITLFLYNSYFYTGNLKLLLIIMSCLLLSSAMLVNLIRQAKNLKHIDSQNLSLREMLVNKIRYFNKPFYWVIQSMALSTAFLPFAVNLTQESADGEFNLSKIYLLVGFYIFTYLFSITLYRLTHNIYLKQLKNALTNLEKNIFDEMGNELKKNKKLRTIIGIGLILLTLAGIVMLILQSR